MHLIVFCCCIRPSFSLYRSFVHSHSMRQGGREKEIGSTRVATRSSCYFFILFYFIFYFPSWKTKESETCTMQIILGRRNGQTAIVVPTLADGFICLRVDTVCLCVGCVTKSWEILTAEMYWWLLLYWRRADNVRGARSGAEKTGRKRSSFFAVDKEQSRRRLERLEEPPYRLFIYFARDEKIPPPVVCVCVCARHSTGGKFFNWLYFPPFHLSRTRSRNQYRDFSPPAMLDQIFSLSLFQALYWKVKI
jgi:hypothetical protein